MSDPNNSLSSHQTNWLDIAGAATHRETLEHILQRYVPVVRNYLMVAHRLHSADAETRALDFVADKFVAGELLQRASERHLDRPTMRFRDYLYQAINRWMIDQYRRQARHAGGKPLDGIAEPVGHDESPDDAFLRTWLTEVLNEALAALHAECRDSDNAVRWNVFRACTLLEPAWKYERCREAFGLNSTGQVAGLLSRGRERFMRLVQARLQAEDRQAADPREELLPLVARCKGMRISDPGFIHFMDDMQSSGDMVPAGTRAGERLTELLVPRSTEGYIQEMLDTPLPVLSTRPEQAEEEGPRTLAELLTHARPSRDVLVRMKDHVKRFNAPENPVEQRNAACWVYAAVLACALVRLGERITTLSTDKLKRCFSENAAMPWGEPELEPLLAQAQEKLERGS